MKTLAVALLVAAAMPIACGNATRSEVRSLPDRFDTVPEGQSLVVFSRPEEQEWGSAFMVVNEDGKFVADVPAKSRVHVVVPAGRHTFVGWESKVMYDYLWASRVEMTTAPGLAYLVYVESLANGLQLIARPERPSKEPCSLEDDALSAQRIESDRMTAEENLADEKVKKQLATSREWFEDLGSPRERQTGSPEDGLPVAALDPAYRRSHPTTFCVRPQPAAR
ncbi:MAG TPA: hypothetical protein VF103_16080 [Polyangiaceae bacterium]